MIYQALGFCCYSGKCKMKSFLLFLEGHACLVPKNLPIVGVAHVFAGFPSSALELYPMLSRIYHFALIWLDQHDVINIVMYR